MPFDSRLKAIREAGFDAATIWWGEEEFYRTGQKDTIPKMVRDHGLFLENIHVPFDRCNYLWSEDASMRESIISDHLMWLEDCTRHQIPTMVIHISRGKPKKCPNRYGIESLMRIITTAEALGVIVAVENTRSEDYLDFILSEIQSPNLRFCYDSSHDWIYSKERTSVLRKHGHRLSAVHFSDNDGMVDRHWLPGEGVIDWNRISEAFPQEYIGVLSLEVIPSRRNRPSKAENFLAMAYERAVWLAELLPKPDEPRIYDDKHG
jgi:sugar phosphate isomerase/epimerase